MNIMLISKCSGSALKETRRILDQFAERRGDRAWQTAITQQGMITLRKMLRKTARRNTSVACHWIKASNRTELLWVVGNAKWFNEQGAVPTNQTKHDVLKKDDENNWHTTQAISLLAALAGLFHDFGKANALFQEKLKSDACKQEPYRHEWVSLRLFEAIVGHKSDAEWLNDLANMTPGEEDAVLKKVIKDKPQNSPNPFKTLPPLARVIAWLIVSHHRLPKRLNKEGAPALKVAYINKWLTENVDASWNSSQCEDESKWTKKDFDLVWSFPNGTPIRSKIWCSKANRLATHALEHAKLMNPDNGLEWLDDKFSSHLARLVLMLSDHSYSSGSFIKKWQDKTYDAYANTDKEGHLKQKLDEHNVGVGLNARYLATILPDLRKTLPAITRHKGFKKRSTHVNFQWQNKAYELACAIQPRARKQGFFGVNMASTGCGKTFANARIMYGLSDEKIGCRFNVALGLRTLTLQTGDALRDRLHLEDDDLAVLIGSQAVSHLYARQRDDNQEKEGRGTFTGSESQEDLFDASQYVRFDGSLDDGKLSQWLKRSPKLHKLVSAPVVVSTIDHLIPATEGVRGGRQIAPMLRLLTSDLVLDEPDDFGLQDLPALTRLVNWAGMLGSHVLLSSASLPPDFVSALFEAYQEGRKYYKNACLDPSVKDAVCCAWFDEKQKPQQIDCSDFHEFTSAHDKFTSKRVKNLSHNTPLRKAEICPITPATTSTHDVVNTVSEVLHDKIFELHNAHAEQHQETGKCCSTGLVRMANINPMVSVAKHLLTLSPPKDYRIHFCVYHSQYPLLYRSHIENTLDAMLSRGEPHHFWQVPAVKQALNQPERNHIFLVFASPVAEVGRDHDYDWAIAEPSSMRSLIQLAGRIQRHRQKIPKEPNLLIFNKNIKALKGNKVAYHNPGFEKTPGFLLQSKDLHDALKPEQYQSISAAPRIRSAQALAPNQNLVALEHAHLKACLFGHEMYKTHASLWWANNPTWSAVLQERTPFRASREQSEFVLYLEDEESELEWQKIAQDDGRLIPVDAYRFENAPFQTSDRVQPFITKSLETLIIELAEELDQNVSKTCIQFSNLRLEDNSEKRLKERWLFHPWLGVFKETR